MEYIRARREVRHALVISDPQPVENVTNVWLSAGQAANIGIFLILFGAFLYIGRAILLPILAASIVALTLAPLVKAAKRHGISPWLTSLVIVALGLGALGLAATMLAGPVSEWIGRAPEIGATIKDRLAVLDRPTAALHELQTTLFGTDNGAVNVNTPASSFVLPMVAFVTPAAGELLLFFGTLLFFLIGQIELRTSLVSLFGNRDTKLRFLKIMRDIERNLAGYLTVVTIINAALGTIVAIGTWLIGYPNPVIFGILAALLNYVPYVGPGIMVIVLFGVGLVSFPSHRSRRHRADRFHCSHHHGRTFGHADHRRPPPHPQPALGAAGAGVLDLDVGPVRRLPRRAAVDRRPGRVQPFVSDRRGRIARLTASVGSLI